MSRLRRIVTIQNFFFVTAVTRDREPILTQNAALLLRCFENSTERTGVNFLAWVIMPDHYHMICDIKDYSLADFQRRIKNNFIALYQKESRSQDLKAGLGLRKPESELKTQDFKAGLGLRKPESESKTQDFKAGLGLRKPESESKTQDFKAGLGLKELSPKSENHSNCRLWQSRYWDRIIRDEEELERLTNYIHYNPVAAGLVERPSDYRWSSYGEYLTQGMYPEDWGIGNKIEFPGEFGEPEPKSK